MITSDLGRYVGAPIRSLQEMLRTISFVEPLLPSILPNGRYGEGTMEAVMIFQKINDLPITGNVDLATWDAIVSEHGRALEELAPPRTAELFSRAEEELVPGQRTLALYPIQGMFLALSERLSDVRRAQPTGVFDEATAQNVRWLRDRGGLAPTGIFDQAAWTLLCRLYGTFVSRRTWDGALP